jgi:hypothetical protein
VTLSIGGNDARFTDIMKPGRNDPDGGFEADSELVEPGCRRRLPPGGLGPVRRIKSEGSGGASSTLGVPPLREGVPSPASAA